MTSSWSSSLSSEDMHWDFVCLMPRTIRNPSTKLLSRIFTLDFCPETLPLIVKPGRATVPGEWTAHLRIVTEVRIVTLLYFKIPMVWMRAITTWPAVTRPISTTGSTVPSLSPPAERWRRRSITNTKYTWVVVEDTSAPSQMMEQLMGPLLDSDLVSDRDVRRTLAQTPLSFPLSIVP